MANEHWFQIKETENAEWKFQFMLWAAIHLPLKWIECFAAVVVFFFYLGASPVRKRSRLYLEHVFAMRNQKVPHFAVYRHILAFALSMVEKIRGWAGKINLSELETQNDDIDKLIESLDSGEGAFVLCSHLGNIEAIRSLTGFRKEHTHRIFQVFPVVDFSGTRKFNTILHKLNPSLMKNAFDANTIGPDSVIAMHEQIASGNLIAIAGDRTSSHFEKRQISLPFLGENAAFPEGAFTLACVLKAPVYFIFAFRKKDLDITSPYEFHVIHSSVTWTGKRSEQKKKIAELAAEFTSHLERFCLQHPYQWYNFYNFWSKGELS